MNPTIKALWMAALRSDKYRQVRHYLSDSMNGRCCLGVLCDLAVEAGIVRRDLSGRTIYIAVDDPTDVGVSLLPHAVVRWAELQDINPSITSLGTATELNDDLSLSFERIADLIDKGL